MNDRRKAWREYACAALSRSAATPYWAASQADAMLEEEDKRFNKPVLPQPSPVLPPLPTNAVLIGRGPHRTNSTWDRYFDGWIYDPLNPMSGWMRGMVLGSRPDMFYCVPKDSPILSYLDLA